MVTCWLCSNEDLLVSSTLHCDESKKGHWRASGLQGWEIQAEPCTLVTGQEYGWLGAGAGSWALRNVKHLSGWRKHPETTGLCGVRKEEMKPWSEGELKSFSAGGGLCLYTPRRSIWDGTRRTQDPFSLSVSIVSFFFQLKDKCQFNHFLHLYSL